MTKRSKIRMSIGWVYPIGIFTSYILLLLEYLLRKMLVNDGIEIMQFPYLTIILVALMFLVLGIVQWFRYRNWIYPALGFLIGITTAQVAFIFPGGSHPDSLKVFYFISFILIILFVLLNWNSFYSHERYEVNSRRLFRLASERIISASNGYTARPYTGKKVECSRDELLGFTRFLSGNYIVKPFYYDTYICLAFSMNKSLVVVSEGSEVSHAIIKYDGTLTIKISDRDYHDYNERLSFDELCSSFSDIFSRFLEYYKSGHESRIGEELKSARSI